MLKPDSKYVTQSPLYFYSYRRAAEAVVLGIDPKTVTPSLQINFNFCFGSFFLAFDNSFVSPFYNLILICLLLFGQIQIWLSFADGNHSCWYTVLYFSRNQIVFWVHLASSWLSKLLQNGPLVSELNPIIHDLYAGT